MKKAKEIDVSMFWNIYTTLTYNALFNFIVGNRGGGKSYGAKKRAIENFIKKKEQFGYVRRYKEDLKKPMEQFFTDVGQEFTEYEFKVESDKFYCRLKPVEENAKWTDDDICGYGFSLSTANNRKSISYPNITMLIFDEFLLEKGNQVYLNNEVEKFLNLYETIARPGTGHPRVVVFFLANAISVTNPYFMYWQLKMPNTLDKNGKYIWKHPKKPILVEDVRNADFIEAKKNTEFGSLVAGTKYADYSIENKFLLDDDTFIEKKGSKARYYFTFIYKNNKFGVWADFNEGKMWVSEDVDPSFLLVYSTTLKDHTPNTMFIKTKAKTGHFKTFVENYKIGLVYFENMNVKNLCYEVIQMIMNQEEKNDP